MMMYDLIGMGYGGIWFLSICIRFGSFSMENGKGGKIPLDGRTVC